MKKRLLLRRMIVKGAVANGLPSCEKLSRPRRPSRQGRFSLAGKSSCSIACMFAEEVKQTVAIKIECTSKDSFRGIVEQIY
jgi:hypothetical protein